MTAYILPPEKHKDKNGNSPEVGGFIRSSLSSEQARIIQIDQNIVFHSCWFLDEETRTNVLVREISELIEERYTFEPKPQEPKKEIPPDGTPVRLTNMTDRVYISAGKMDGDGLCVYASHGFSGNTISSRFWEVI